MFIKVCGITRPADAEAAVECGASAIGFVFWPESPRLIDPYRARAIAARLPPFVTPVGVFVNQAQEYVNAVTGLVRLGAVQLHGDETPAYVAGIVRPVVKMVQVGAGNDEGWGERWSERIVLLVDVHDPVRRGGTGLTADWDGAARLSARRRVVLAGGLTAANVGDAIARVRPFGLDVSSGVESSPGVKDYARLGEFFAAIRSAREVPAQ